MSRFDRVGYAGIALLVWIYLMSAIALIGCEFGNSSAANVHKGRGRARLGSRGMVFGMATTKLTITLPNRQLEEIRRRVAAQDSPSVSGFVQQAVQKSLENAAEFHAMVEEALKETGGPLKPRERAWARRMLSARKRGTKPRKVA